MNKQAYEHMVGLALDKQAGLGNLALRGLKHISRIGRGAGGLLQDAATKPGGLLAGKGGSKFLYNIGDKLQTGAANMRTAVQNSRKSGLLKSMEDGTLGKGLKTLGGDIYRYGRRALSNAPLIGKYMPAQNKHLGSFLHNMGNVTNDGMGRLMARRYGEHVGRAAAHVGRNRGKYIAGAMATPTVASWFGSDEE